MDFVVLKVNGKDVSSASHEETIAAFTTAQEPIIVEVLKRLPKQDDMASCQSAPVSLLCNTSTQTDCLTNTQTQDWEQPNFPNTQNSFFVPPPSTSYLSNEADTHHYSTIGGEAEAEEDDGCDVEYEEVVLLRSPQDTKLGLTLCYGSPDEPDTDIYISEIEQSSIAARDGRIQEGDQLLQINGIDVRSRDQAVSLFSERRPDFTLMLARPQSMEHEEEEEEEEATTDTGTTENAHHEKDSGVGRTDESTKNDESSEQDAGDTYSIPGDFNSYPNILFNNYTSPFQNRENVGENLILKQEFHRIQTQVSNKGVTLAPLCRFQSDASLDREMALLNKEMENIQLECETLVHRHLESQQKTSNVTDVSRCQLEHVYVNLSDLNAAKNGQEPGMPMSKKQTVERWVNSMFLPRKCTNQQNDRDSSSAYNTADSSGSGRLTLELTPMSTRYDEMYGSVMSLVSPKMEDKGTQLRDSDVASMFSCDSCRRCCKALVEREALPPVIPTVTKNAVTNSNLSSLQNGKSTQNKGYRYITDSTIERQKEEKNRNYVTFFPPPNTMYTNQANLQHTIWLQQQMLRQAAAQQRLPRSASSSSSTQNSISSQGFGMNSKHVISTSSRGQSSSGPSSQSGHQMGSSSSKSGTLSTVREEEEMKMEWKVKRRADGTRYITRRPVRNRLLKARAMKILEERAGITTDDDTVSELKTGRYWSKEERKRHLEKARDRKRKEMVIRSKMAIKEQGEDGEDGKKELSILELSHKKMMKRRGKIVFDDFTTIQEVLAHGSKISSPDAKPLGLLTVTTV